MGQNLIQTLNVQLERLIQKSKLNNKLIVYTLGNTRVLNNSNFYPTPIREFDTFIVAGMVVFSENEAKIVQELNTIQGKPMDIGGYYKPNEDLVSDAMQASKIFKSILHCI